MISINRLQWLTPQVYIWTPFKRFMPCSYQFIFIIKERHYAGLLILSVQYNKNCKLLTFFSFQPWYRPWELFVYFLLIVILALHICVDQKFVQFSRIAHALISQTILTSCWFFAEAHTNTIQFLFILDDTTLKCLEDIKSLYNVYKDS